MKYVKAYDPVWDELFQCRVDDETAKRMQANVIFSPQVFDVSDQPFPRLPVLSRFRSERHPT